jgi:hypothetical protein
VLRYAEDRRRGGVDDLPDPGILCGFQQQFRAQNIDRFKEILVLGQGHLGNVVVNDADPLAGLADGRVVADVALDKLHAGGPVAGVIQVEDPTGLAELDNFLRQESAEVSGAAGYQDSVLGHGGAHKLKRIKRRAAII